MTYEANSKRLSRNKWESGSTFQLLRAVESTTQGARHLRLDSTAFGLHTTFALSSNAGSVWSITLGYEARLQ
jgi:hypothetical protein